jgi:FkbM family methyltransferase
VQNNIPLAGKIDALRIFRQRSAKVETIHPIHLVQSKIFVDGQSAKVDLHVFAQVFLDQIYERLDLTGRVVLDIGAHKGYFAAYALSKGAKAVLCYEPEDSNFRALSLFSRSVTSSHQPIEVYHEAVGNDEEMELYVSVDSWAHTTVSRNDLAYTKKVKIASRSLASILATVGERFPRDEFVLKIDAEGAECQLVLQTPYEFFSSVREIVVEFHEFAECSLTEIAERLVSIGYEYIADSSKTDIYHWRARKTTAR